MFRTVFDAAAISVAMLLVLLLVCCTLFSRHGKIILRWVKTVGSYMFYFSGNQELAHAQPVCYVLVGCCRTGCCCLTVVLLDVYKVVMPPCCRELLLFRATAVLPATAVQYATYVKNLKIRI